MTDKFDNEFSRLMLEMSKRVEAVRTSPLDYVNLWNKQKHLAKHTEEFDLNGRTFSIYYVMFGDSLEFFFLHGEDLAWYFSFNLLEDDGIEMNTVCKVFSNGIMVERIYIEFLLKHFKYILSDYTHTPKGFGIYQRLAESPEVTVSVIKGNDVIQSGVNSEELKKYYGGPEMYEYIYKVELK